MKQSIHTLVTDIYDTISRKDGWFTDVLADELGHTIAKRLQTQLGDERPAPRLRLSRLGPICPKALWYSIYHPELAEALPPQAEIKYSFGHIIEALAITLAKASGHLVEGEQDELTVDDVKGHRDCVIDGCIVDVKSCSSISFNKFKSGSIRDEDHFGYLDQLDAYLVGSADDPLVKVKDRAYILAIDKTLGHVCLYEHRLRADSIRSRISAYKEIIGMETPPRCECGCVSDGKSGNIRLDTRASYSPFKYCCFPNLRTFLYSNGPVFLSTVARRPAEHILEVDRHGNVVYN